MDTKQETFENIALSLVEWYEISRRILPWREECTPYRVFVCEIMAQQTQIATLLPYFQRFTARFPDVYALAAAGEGEVLKAWEGLGYYSRARNLHKTAKLVVEKYGGKFPDTETELLALPGIGDYTAGAILSIAFGKPYAAADGNALRVYSRICLDRTDVRLSEAKASAKHFLTTLMSFAPPSSVSQGIMELGATVCVPKKPQCDLCPVCKTCRALAAGVQGELPVKGAANAPKEEFKTIFIVRRAGEILLRQRTGKLLGGLWEFLSVEGILNEPAARSFLEDSGFEVLTLSTTGQSEHRFTHKIWRMSGYRAEVHGEAPEGFAFFTKEDIKKLPFPTAFKKFTEQI